MRYFIELAYNGTHYHGWQKQPGDVTVQQTLEEALEKILRRPAEVTGCGRTDAGVNARKFYAHFDATEQELPRISDSRRFIGSLNSLCGRDIAIRRVFQVADDLHARFDALARTYKYFITFRKNPFLSPLAWFCPSRLDIEKMNEAAGVLLDTEDFTSFAKLHADTATNICKVTQAGWVRMSEAGQLPLLEEDGIVFTITANRFLRNMVRTVVGTLLEVGRGKMGIDEFRDVIKRKDRCAAGQSVPGEALFLWDVKYPDF